MRSQNASVVKLDALVQTTRHVAHRWRAVAAWVKCAARHRNQRGHNRKNRKDQTTGEKTIGRQQKKQCAATRAAEVWRTDNRIYVRREIGTQRPGPRSVE